MSKCATNELTRNTFYLSFSLLLLGETMNAKSPKWWTVADL